MTFARVLACAVVIATQTTCCGAMAQQDWPSKAIKLVIPYEAGGLADRLGRIVAERLSHDLGQQVYAENHGGSAGLIAGGIVAKAEPDGYTLMVGGTGPHVTGPLTRTSIRYDPLKDFTHIALIGGDVFVLAVNPARGWKTLSDLAAASAAASPPLGYGTTGLAAPTHLAMELFLSKAKLKMSHVPYRGAGPAINDAIGNHLPVLLVTLSSLGQHIKAGTLTALAIATPSRHPAFPDIPTFAELGYRDVEGGTWFWLSGPAKLPGAVVARLNTLVRAILQRPEVRQIFAAQGMTTRDYDVAQFQEFVERDIRHWSAVVKALQIKPE